MSPARCAALTLAALSLGCTAARAPFAEPADVVASPDERSAPLADGAVEDIAAAFSPKSMLSFGDVRRDVNGVDVHYEIFVGVPVAMAQDLVDLPRGTVVRPVASFFQFRFRGRMLGTTSGLNYFRADANEPDAFSSVENVRGTFPSESDAPEPFWLEIHVQPTTKSWADVASERDVEVIVTTRPYVPREGGRVERARPATPR